MKQSHKCGFVGERASAAHTVNAISQFFRSVIRKNEVFGEVPESGSGRGFQWLQL